MNSNTTPAGVGMEKGFEPQRFLAFSLCDEEYAVPLLKVKEVIAMPDITPVPYTPTHFLGIMNLRGQVISIIDLRMKFKMAKADQSAETAVIILDLEPLCLGVVVNSVNSVLAVGGNEIAPRPDIESSKSADWIMGVVKREKQLVLLLDLNRALSVDELKAINRTTQGKAA